MVSDLERFLGEHRHITRRFFLRASAGGAAIAGIWPWRANAEPAPELAEAVAKLESYLTPQAQFRDVSRGKPIPHQLSEQQKRDAGITRETWSLEFVSDAEQKADLRNPLTKEKGTALDFAGLMQLSQQHAVRFAKVMTCLNIGCPLGMGIWEGVPLREVFWKTQPRRDIRRIFYYGYHNEKPDQMFRSSLPIDRVLEDPDGLPPVILCYKLNGQWLSGERGGPVRMVVPEAYGFKSIKWLTHVVATNLYHANDTYAEGNNDVSSRLKTFAATLSAPAKLKAGQPIPITGYAQVGVSGLSKVQVWIQNEKDKLPAGDPYFRQAPWNDAAILPPPDHWGGDLPNDALPADVKGFDPQTGKPLTWPMRLAKVHWAIVCDGLPAGEYTLRCRAIDQNGAAQPMPRPFRKSGHAAIEEVRFLVEA